MWRLLAACSISAILVFIPSCRKDISVSDIQTEHVVILVIDGPRYSETWGMQNMPHIPYQSTVLYNQGVFNSNFRNEGPTHTTAGHTALTTGYYQQINNTGQELPEFHSIFQQYLKSTGADNTDAWVIASKDKLQVLANCTETDWQDMYMPSNNCGVNGAGVGSGYRHDSLTLQSVFDILGTHHPTLTLINFREPDYSGHQNNWNNYLLGIQNTDIYVNQIWNWIQNDPEYAGTTTLLITNDHGRHLDGQADGFISHGDGCEGCRHISLLALGPDFKKGETVSTLRDQRDVTATACHLLGIEKVGEGEVMWELLR